MATNYINKVKIGATEHLIEPTLYVAPTLSNSAYSASLDNFALVTGATIQAKFAVTNPENATLNINSTGAKNIFYNNAKITASQFKVNHVYTLVYDGTQWQVVGDVDTGSGVTKISTGAGLTGGDITTTGTISLADSYGDTKNPYGAKAKNLILAGPSSGSNAVPSFRALVAADIPALAYVPVASNVSNDMDTYYNTGIYNITTGSLTNGPASYGYGQLLVMSYRKPSGNTTTDWAMQLYSHLGSGNNGNTLYYRTSNASTWQTWQMVAHADAGTAKGGAKTPIYINAKGEIQEGTVLKNLAYKDSLVASDIPNLSWTKITSDKPTTLSGYGITDAAASNHSHTLKIGNKSLSVSTSEQTWSVHDILKSDTNINATTSWQIYDPGVYYVAASATFTGEGNPESANGGLAPYRYGQLIVSRAGNGGVAQFYVAHTASGAGNGLKFRTGWNNAYLDTWRSILDSTNYKTYAWARPSSITSGQAVISSGTDGSTALRAILNNTSKSALGWNSSGNTHADNLRLVDVNTIAYWNGAYSGTSSNLSILGTVTTGTWNASVIGAAYGGTGQNTLQKSANALINALDTGASDLTANDYVITQYVGGGTTTTTYHRRPASKVVNATLVKAALGTVSTTAKKFLKDTGAWAQVDWEDLTGKPSTFTPSSHEHSYIGKNNGFIAYPSDGCYTASNSTVTGYIKIKIPQTKSMTMFTFDVDIYNYANSTSTRYHIGGYNYSDASWNNCTAYCIAPLLNKKANLTVRFLSNGDDEMYVTIGQADTSWSYPQITIHNIAISFGSQATLAKWKSGWTVTIDSTAFDDSLVKQTITNTNIAYTTQINTAAPTASGKIGYFAITPATSGSNTLIAQDSLYIYDTVANNAITNVYFCVGKQNSIKGGITLQAGNSYYGDLVPATLTANRTYTFPDATGTIALSSTTLSGYGITNAVQYNGIDNDIGSSATATNAKTYWANNNKVPKGKVVFNYNSSGTEYTTLFSNNNNSYGSILRWGYSDNYIRILRAHPNQTTYNGWYTEDWEKISAGYADSAGKATNDVDGNAIKTTYAKLASPTFTGTPKSVTPSSSSDSKMIATKEYVDGIVAANDAMVYKGVKAGAATSSSNAYGALTPAANCGDTYKVSVAGFINGLRVEVGDMLICITDNTAEATSSNYTTIRNNWNIIQTSEGSVSTSSTSSTDNAIARWDSTSGRIIQDSKIIIDDNGNLLISHATSATMTADSTNPKITFAENGSQPVHLIYSDYDSYRSPAGLKIIGGTSATPAWLEVEGNVYAAAFKGNADTATTATNLAAKPSLAASGNNITVTAGGKTSDTFTVPYATSAGYATQLSFKNGRIASADLDISTMHSRMLLTLASSSMTTSKPPMGDGYIVTYGWDNAYWGAQQAISHTKTPHMAIRGTNGSSTNDWGDWIYLLDANNYTDYTVTKTGSGASGSWGISVTGSSASCTGNATTATAIQTAGTTAQFWRGDNSWSNVLKQSATATLGIDSNLKIGTAVKDLHFSLGSGSGTAIDSGNGGGITFGTDTASYGGIYWQTSGSYGSRLHFATTGSFANGAYTRMIITHDGKVGIGTLSPSYLLSVNGDISATNFRGTHIGKLSVVHASGDQQEIRIAYSDTIDYWWGVGTGNENHGLYDNKAAKWILSAGTANTWTFVGNVTGNVSGTAANVTGTVAIAHGGTGLTSADPHKVLIGPSTGTAAAAPTWRTIVAADLPSASTSAAGIIQIGTAATNAMAGNTTVTNVAISANTTTNANYPVVFATTNKDTTTAKTEGLQKSGAKFYFNPSTGILTATGFAGALTGNVTGNVTGSSGSCTGNAATASKISAKLAATTKTYLLGTSTTLTATAANVELIGDTGVYATTIEGGFSAVRHYFNIGGTEKAYITYNSTDNSLDFVFV